MSFSRLPLCIFGIVVSLALAFCGYNTAKTPHHAILWDVAGHILVMLGFCLFSLIALVVHYGETRGASVYIHLGSSGNRPPLNAEFLLYLFMGRQSCDALVGDLEERYKVIRKKFGQRRANVWYWTQVFISLRPIILAWVKKMSGVVALIEAYRRMRS